MEALFFSLIILSSETTQFVYIFALARNSRGEYCGQSVETLDLKFEKKGTHGDEDDEKQDNAANAAFSLKNI